MHSQSAASNRGQAIHKINFPLNPIAYVGYPPLAQNLKKIWDSKGRCMTKYLVALDKLKFCPHKVVRLLVALRGPWDQ